MSARFQRGDLLLATMTFSSQTGSKLRPVLVLRDAGDEDLLILPVTSQRPRVRYDVSLTDWRGSGLKLPSVVRVEKLATVEKSAVIRRLGSVSGPDWSSVESSLQTLFAEILLPSTSAAP